MKCSKEKIWLIREEKSKAIKKHDFSDKKKKQSNFLNPSSTDSVLLKVHLYIYLSYHLGYIKSTKIFQKDCRILVGEVLSWNHISMNFTHVGANFKWRILICARRHH